MSPNDVRVVVVGLGYIGLPTAAVLASRGYQVHGVEVNPSVVSTINAGRIHIVEPELDILVRAAVQTGSLRAHPTPELGDVFIIAVPTPFRGADHSPDLSYVEAATRAISPYLREGNLVILESTSPPGTTEMIASIVRAETGLSPPAIRFAHAPERVLPGKVLREVVENDRVIGGLDDTSTDAAIEFYRTFVSGEIFPTTARMAETVKLAENAFRDVNIAFANELSIFADELDLDVWELIRLANRHPRVNILQPGCGVGGHCIAVDPWFLAHAAPKNTRLIQTARAVNEGKPHWVTQRVLKHAERFKKPVVAVLGLAYKPDIDDLRESAAVEVVNQLVESGLCDLRIVEPNITSHPGFALRSLEEALNEADIVLFLVAHRQFRKLPPRLLSEKVLIDTCGVLARND
jgi:UDP-N-acetyl-D-mannosaminuronic acid dehydrogenase